MIVEAKRERERKRSLEETMREMDRRVEAKTKRE